MELRHLLLVKTIVEEGSIAKAKDVLHLTQSALSHQLKECETHFDTPLFHRINKKLVLTVAGQKVYDTAIVILKETNKLKCEIASLNGEEKGVLRICIGCYTTYHWLPTVLHRFNQIYPNVEVKIVIEATHEPVQCLLKGELDLAIVNNMVKTDQIDYTELFKSEMFAVVPPNHPWTKRKYLTAEDFKDETLIIYSKPMDTVVFYNKVLKPKNIEPKKVMEISLTEGIMEMVLANFGVSVMTQLETKPFLDANRIATVKVTKNGVFRDHFIARLKNAEYPSYMKTFIEFVKENMIID